MIGHHADRGGRFAVRELLDWSGDELPDDKVIRKLAVRIKEQGRHPLSLFMVGEPTPGQKGRDRLVHLGRKSKPAQKLGGYSGLPWKYFDELLAKLFDLS